MIVLISINVFANNKINDNNIIATDNDINIDDEKDLSIYDYQTYEDTMRRQFLEDDNKSLEERVYSEYNIPLDIFENLSERVILSIYDTDFDLNDTLKIYEGMGYEKTSNFIKELQKNTPDSMPTIKSNTCYIHNDKYETRTILLFSNGDKATVNIAYNKTIPYLYFADNVKFKSTGLHFDIRNNDINMLDDYCVSKGENLSQYADMDDFMRNFILAIIGIIVLILIINILNNNTKNINIDSDLDIINKDNKKIDDNKLVAILTAAIAAYENKSVNNLRIKTIRKNIRFKNV